MALKTAQIGRAGELLVQYRLLLLGIESAPMTTDSGVDLVAYAPGRSEAITIQVKTNLKAKPGGGRGKLSLDWWVPDDSSAQLQALVDLAEQRVWILTLAELAEVAQQHPKGRHHFFMYVDPAYVPRSATRVANVRDFQQYLLENRAANLLGA